jgi:hypothetical protein
MNTRPWINPATNKLHSVLSIKQILLGLGLALREYDQAHFSHDDDLPADFPDYGRNTTIMGYNSLIRVLTTVIDDIERLNHFTSKKIII